MVEPMLIDRLTFKDRWRLAGRTSPSVEHHDGNPCADSFYACQCWCRWCLGMPMVEDTA